MTDEIIKEKVELLESKNNSKAYAALLELEKECKKSDKIYKYMDTFISMTDDDSSYIRTRGLRLIAANVRWDKKNKINDEFCKLLLHITDEKPITARRFIKSLCSICQYKPELKAQAVFALQTADISDYPESMIGLVRKDIDNTLNKIK